MEFSGIFWEHLENSATLIFEPLAFKVDKTSDPQSMSVYRFEQDSDSLLRKLSHKRKTGMPGFSCLLLLGRGGYLFHYVWSPTLY